MAFPTIVVNPGSSPGTTINTLPNAGQSTMANSLSVTTASDQTVAAVASVASTAIESNHVLKASAGSLLSVICNIGATSGWLMIFDATSAPVDGAVTPIWELPIDSNGVNGYGSYAWAVPLKFSTGCTVVFSTTGFVTKTASATATFMGQIQ